MIIDDFLKQMTIYFPTIKKIWMNTYKNSEKDWILLL